MRPPGLQNWSARVWEPHSPEVLKDMRDHLEELERLGIEAIND